MLMSLIIIKQYRLKRLTAFKSIYNVQTSDRFSQNQYLALDVRGRWEKIIIITIKPKQNVQCFDQIAILYKL